MDALRSNISLDQTADSTLTSLLATGCCTLALVFAASILPSSALAEEPAFEVVPFDDLDDFADPLPPFCAAPELSDAGVTIRFLEVPNASAYTLYRKGPDGTDWVETARLDGGEEPVFLDADISAGTTYTYAVTSSNALSESSFSIPATCKVPPVSVPKQVRSKAGSKASAGSVTLTWDCADNCDGFELECAGNGILRNAKAKTAKAKARKAKVGGLSLSKLTSGRIRAFKTYGDKTSYSPWTYAQNMRAAAYPTSASVKHRVKKTVKKTKKVKKVVNGEETVVKKVVKKTKKVTIAFELRSSAKQKLYRYDTLQGSCTDGTYGYFALYNRSVEKCKIAKVRLSSMKVVRVSRPLAVDHANDLAYDKKRKKVVAVNSSVHRDRVSIIDPQKLSIVKQVSIPFPSKIEGATAGQTKRMTGITAMGYDPKRKQFVGVVKGSHNLVVMDRDFVPKRYIVLDKPAGQVVQGLEISGDMLLVVEAAEYSGQYNRVSVYDYEGTLVRRINFTDGMELEGAYFHKGKLYACYYNTAEYVKSKKGKKAYKTVRRNYIRKVAYY